MTDASVDDVQNYDKKTAEPARPEKATSFKLPTRKVIIDPAYIIYFMFHVASMPLANQYIYYAIGEKHNLSAILDEEKTNGSVGRGGEGPCGATSNKSGPAFDVQQKVQAETAIFNLYLDLISDIPGLFVILFFGTLMDKFGRRPTLILPLVGVIVRNSVYPLQQVLKLPLEVIAVGNVVDALLGGMPTFITACFAYFADTLPASRRGHRLSIVDVGNMLLQSMMSVVVGYMIQYLGFVWPYVLILCGHVCNLVYVCLFVPESRVSTGGSCKDVSPMYIIRSFKILGKKRPGNGQMLLLVFVTSWSVTAFGIMNRYSLEALYKLNSPFCWTSSMLGVYGGVTSVLTCGTQIFITVVLLKRIGVINVLYISLVSFIAYFIIIGLADTTWVLILSAFVGTATGIQAPLMRSVLSGLVSSNEQGTVFAMSSAIDSILRVCGSAFYNPLYGATLYVFRGTVFMVMAGFILIALILVIIFQYLQSKENKRMQQTQIEDQSNDGIVYTIQL